MDRFWTVTWTLLPNGFAAAGRLRLSLVATLRVSEPGGKLGTSEVMKWPGSVRSRLEGATVVEAGSGHRLPVTLLGPPPRKDWWDLVFSRDTPVDAPPKDDTPIFVPVVTSLHYRPALESLEAIYSSAVASHPTGALPAGHPALSAVAAIADWVDGAAAPPGAVPGGVAAEVARLLDPRDVTAGSIAEAAQRLRDAGQPALADALPIALAGRRLRNAGTPNGARATTQVAKPGALDDIRPVEQADFHQVAGLLLDHPELSLALGLRTDLEIPAFEGTRTLRLGGPDGQPIQGSAPVAQPWSRMTVHDRTFTMAARPGPGSEVAGGMLDLSPETDSRYVATTTDVWGAAQQLRTIARSVRDGDAAHLPPRRNGGITIAQVDRRTTTYKQSMAVAAELAKGLEAPQGDTVLFADDVTGGYRIDVSTDGGPFRSLMRRHVRYRLQHRDDRGQEVHETEDEGAVDAFTVTAQRDPHGDSHLFVGEEVMGWSGWGLAVPPPGRRVGGDLTGQPGAPGTAEEPPVVDAENGTLEGYGLRIEVEPVQGSLPPLRFGHSYTFRARAVDVAGNSIEPGLADPAHVSAPIRYGRLDLVGSPTVVPRFPFSAGESLMHVVVRSDGDGNPLGTVQNPGGLGQRHLLAPQGSQSMAEQHGAFDAAFGPDSPERVAARRVALQVARLEEGRVVDEAVPDPADPARRVPAVGIRVANNEDAPHPPVGQLPLRRGQALPAGEYVVHDTATMLMPGLPDPAARGAAFGALPGATGPTVVEFPGGRWPDLRSVRLVVRPGDDPAAPGSSTVGGTATDRTVEVTLPPSGTAEVVLSTALEAARLDQFDLPLKPDARKAAVAGQVPLISAPQRMTMVHAVRRPLLPLAVASATAAPRAAGSTEATVTGELVLHPPSTAQVDLVATWDEPVDDGVTPFRTEARSATAGAFVVGTDASIPFTQRHALGDTRRRDIRYTVRGTSKFREYFPAVPDGDLSLTREGESRTVVIPNTGRPERPHVHSIVPTLYHEREAGDDLYTSVRTGHLRVYLRRPWMQTGPDEQLAVITFLDEETGQQALAENRRGAQLVSRYAADPIKGAGTDGPPLVTSDFYGHRSSVSPIALTEPGVHHLDAALHGHDVRFDAERDLWAADVFVDDLDGMPFVRLGLARYQPESVLSCRISRVVTPPPVLLPKRRKLTVERTEGGLRVTVHQKPLPGNKYQAFLVRQQAGTVADGLVYPRTGATTIPVELHRPGMPAEWKGTVPVAGPADLAGRTLVVQEQETGEQLSSPLTRERTVYFDTVAEADLVRLL